MKPLLPFSIMLLLCGSALGDESMDMQARVESVKTLKTHIDMRKERLESVAGEIRRLADQTDAKVGKVVDLLAGLKDSQDSKRRITQIKGEAIGGLKGMIETYARERRGILEKLRTGAGPEADALKADIAKIDAMIDARANDIVRLVKSMPAGSDVAKYEKDGSYYVNGFHYENSRISEGWRQNRRDRVESEKQRREVSQALESAIADLEKRRDTVSSFLKTRKFTDAERELREQELERVEALLANRRAQLLELSTPAADAGQNTADGEQASDLKDFLHDAKRDIGADFARTLQLYHEAAEERAKILRLQENLAAREKWLSEHGATAE